MILQNGMACICEQLWLEFIRCRDALIEYWLTCSQYLCIKTHTFLNAIFPLPSENVNMHLESKCVTLVVVVVSVILLKCNKLCHCPSECTATCQLSLSWAHHCETDTRTNLATQPKYYYSRSIWCCTKRPGGVPTQLNRGKLMSTIVEIN